MSHVADRFIVVLDANVLYPFRMRDALLRFAEAGLFRARWSQMILDEWINSLIKNKPEFEENISSQITAIHRSFPEGLIDGFEDLIDSIKLPDPNDRHVVAAGIVADAEHIVTENLKDFPDDAISKYGIEAVSADDFLASTFELYPEAATSALNKMRNAYRNPTMSPAFFLTDLQANGMPKLVSLAKQYIDVL